jgi:nicotinate phosphoribosyltransferase
VTTTGLLTDHYELTMVAAALADGSAGRRTVFEAFGRQLPPGRRYGVVAGTGRFLDALTRFRFDESELDFLRATRVIDGRTAEFLAGYRFTGNVWGYAEGDCYFPGSPILVVEGTFAESVVLETLALSIYNHDCAIASAAARMVIAAAGRPIIEMGSRRTHEIAAIAAARAAYLAGFASTSNLRAGLEFGVPTAGTSAHAFVMVHDTERQAFAAQLHSLGPGTTLLIDTYDVTAAVATAVELAGQALGAVRIDSGNVAEVSKRVRAQLDALGATGTRIIVTGNLDEYLIEGLRQAPVDGYGVGTALVTGSGAPTAEFVYKLVARSDSAGQLEPVAKLSEGKPTIGGRKWAARSLDEAGQATAEVISLTPGQDRPGLRQLLKPLVRDGEIVGAEPLQAARERLARSLAELPAAARSLAPGGPAIPTRFVSQSPSGSDS